MAVAVAGMVADPKTAPLAVTIWAVWAAVNEKLSEMTKKVTFT